MYTDALTKRGDKVDVVALKKKHQKSRDKVNGVNLYRIQQREVNEKGKLSYLSRLLKFLVKSSIFLTKAHLKEKYDVIHVHSVPDFEVFAALVPKIFGAKIILDIHDIVPEFYASKFKTGYNTNIFRLLVITEKFSTFFSDHVIISNHIWKERLISRSLRQEKCTVIINYPNNAIFYQRESQRKINENRFIAMYPGTLNWHQGLDIAIKAMAILKDKMPDVFLYIYGEGPTKESLKDLIFQLGLDDRVLLKGFLPLNEIVKKMANSDLGVVPKRNDPFGGEAFSTKTLEFMSLGVPIIVSRTKIDEYYFNESIVTFFNPDDEKDLAEQMLLAIQNKNLRKKQTKNAIEFIKYNNWDVKKHVYLDLVDSLSKR
jgi:glycosyltransferase involved in cell wall biosynthesis